MNENEKKPLKSRKKLWIYIAALFSVSLLLILVSYCSQLRMQRELARVNEDVSQRLETTSGALKQAESAVELARKQGADINELRQRIEELENENNAQSARIDELEDAVAKAADSLEAETLRTDAVSALFRLSEAVRTRDWNAAQSASDELLADGLENHLRGGDRERLDELRDTLEKRSK